jgi:hypothetical protein
LEFLVRGVVTHNQFESRAFCEQGRSARQQNGGRGPSAWSSVPGENVAKSRISVEHDLRIRTDDDHSQVLLPREVDRSLDQPLADSTATPCGQYFGVDQRDGISGCSPVEAQLAKTLAIAFGDKRTVLTVFHPD